MPSNWIEAKNQSRNPSISTRFSAKFVNWNLDTGLAFGNINAQRLQIRGKYCAKVVLCMPALTLLTLCFTEMSFENAAETYFEKK